MAPVVRASASCGGARTHYNVVDAGRRLEWLGRSERPTQWMEAVEVETLETFIIDEVRKRERRRDERPAVELPLPEPELDRPVRKSDTDELPPKRGVVVIDLLG